MALPAELHVEERAQRHRRRRSTPWAAPTRIAGRTSRSRRGAPRATRRTTNRGAAVGSTEFYDYGEYEKWRIQGAARSRRSTLRPTVTGSPSATAPVTATRSTSRWPAGVGPTRALAAGGHHQHGSAARGRPGRRCRRLEHSRLPGLPHLPSRARHVVDMTGWAEASYITNASAVVTWYPRSSRSPPTSGVNPNFSSALLRTNNRGVCERCHNK